MKIEFDVTKVTKISKVLTKYDCKIPFECMVELSYMMKEKELEK